MSTRNANRAAAGRVPRTCGPIRGGSVPRAPAKASGVSIGLLTPHRQSGGRRRRLWYRPGPSSPAAQDYKIRYAFAGTPYYGAYMSDLVKGVVMLESNDLVRHLGAQPEIVAWSISTLLDEIDDLGGAPPTVIAFGSVTYRLALRHLPSSRYARLAGVTHYSHYVSKGEYRKRVLAQLSLKSD